jgi:uncharacterized protein (TIGR00730 family)
MATEGRDLQSVCVYCGSSDGHHPGYLAAADELGATLARHGIEVIYGGGRAGLMGRVADAALTAGGRVTGVIPTALFAREVVHRGVTTLVEVASMHERKQAMFDRADAFVALPGGFGTIEELIEIATWAQLGVHAKPIAVLDIAVGPDDAGYWTPLFAMIEQAIAAGFMHEPNRDLIARVPTVADLMPALVGYRPPSARKWMARNQL